MATPAFLKIWLKILQPILSLDRYIHVKTFANNKYFFSTMLEVFGLRAPNPTSLVFYNIVGIYVPEITKETTGTLLFLNLIIISDTRPSTPKTAFIAIFFIWRLLRRIAYRAAGIAMINFIYMPQLDTCMYLGKSLLPILKNLTGCNDSVANIARFLLKIKLID